MNNTHRRQHGGPKPNLILVVLELGLLVQRLQQYYDHKRNGQYHLEGL